MVFEWKWISINIIIWKSIVYIISKEERIKHLLYDKVLFRESAKNHFLPNFDLFGHVARQLHEVILVFAREQSVDWGVDTITENICVVRQKKCRDHDNEAHSTADTRDHLQTERPSLISHRQVDPAHAFRYNSTRAA